MTLTDAELPASPAFIEFLHATITGKEQYVGDWFKQEDESLILDKERFKDIQEKAHAVTSTMQGKQYMLRAYGFFKEMLLGDFRTIKEIARFRFFFVVGIPRTGGTYITKQLFTAQGLDYKNVQNALAHDGFPHLSYLTFKGKMNFHTKSLLQLGEYLTMVEIFFGTHGRLAYHGGIMVPKKFTKAVYHFDLIRGIMGRNAEYIITLRHPLSVIKSILDKSGGLPNDGKFVLRSAIERWALEDWLHWGVPVEEISKMDYITCLLGYWKRYHFQMAMAGLPLMPEARIIPYGEEYMRECVTEVYRDLGVDKEPEPFKQAEPPVFDDKYEAEAQKVMEEVASFWKSLGMEFPIAALEKKL